MEKELIFKIYLITNSINGSQYVGQTRRSPERRLVEHTSGCGCQLLNRAIKKYGKENFSIETVCEAATSELANELEQEYILKYGTLNPNGYNLTTGGVKFHFSETTKLKISKSKTGVPMPEETKLKISQILANKPWTEKRQQQISLMVSSRPEKRGPLSEEWKRKLSESVKLTLSNNPKALENCAKGGKMSACLVWNIKRGKPCTCGYHDGYQETQLSDRV